MRTNRIVLIVILATLAIYSACRKLDMSSKDATTESIKQKEERFFNTSTAIPLQVQALSEYMKRENFRVGFVNKTVNQIGYPRWDKSLIYSGKRQGPGGRGSTGDSVSLVYIPFVRDSQQYVNASLIIKTTPTDTVYKYLCDWQYKDLGFDTTGTNWNAFDAFLVFATLDKNVFNRNRFVIKDSNLLNPVVSSLLSSAGKKFDSTKIVYTLEAIQGAGRGSDYWDINTICYQIGACIESTTIRGATVGSCPSNSFWVEWTECYDTWVWIETGGGSGGSGNGNGNGGSGTGGGGSGSGSGGGTPPECDPIAVKGMNVVPGCDPGWEPEPDEPPISNEQPIDTLLKNYSLLVNKYRDSLSSLCESEHKERFFNIVEYNSQLDTFRVITGLSDDEVKPNYNMLGSRILKGSWHYHPKYSDGTPGSWPSGSDVAQLYDKSQGFVMLIDTEQGRYALVVENKAKLDIWKNIFGNGPKLFPEKVYNAVLSDPRAYSTGNDFVTMTKEIILDKLGNSSICGIGLYQANSYNGTSFTKIN